MLSFLIWFINIPPHPLRWPQVFWTVGCELIHRQSDWDGEMHLNRLLRLSVFTQVNFCLEPEASLLDFVDFTVAKSSSWSSIMDVSMLNLQSLYPTSSFCTSWNVSSTSILLLLFLSQLYPIWEVDWPGYVSRFSLHKAKPSGGFPAMKRWTWLEWQQALSSSRFWRVVAGRHGAIPAWASSTMSELQSFHPALPHSDFSWGATKS